MAALTVPANALSEMTALRTANSKTWDIGNGLRTAVHSIAPVHWQDRLGQWREHDLTIDPKTFRVGSAPHQIEVRDIGVTVNHFNGDTVSIDLVSVGNVTSGWPTMRTVAGSKIVWSEVAPGVDIELEVTASGVRFWQVIKNDSAPRSFAWQFTEAAGLKILQTDLNVTGADANNQAAQLTTTKSAISTDNKGNATYTLSVLWSGNVKVRDPVTRRASWQPAPTYPVDIDPTVTVQISADANDGWEKVKSGTTYGWISVSEYLTHYLYSGITPYSGNPGWRWPLAVPQGVTVSSATLTLTVASSGNLGGGCAAYIYGNLASSAAAWNSGSPPARPSNRSKTVSKTALAATATPGAVNATVTSQVQEIVNQGAWASGNVAELFAIPTSSASPAHQTHIVDYHTTPAQSAQLSVTYAAAAPIVNRALTITREPVMNSVTW